MLIKDRLEFEYIYCAFEALIIHIRQSDDPKRILRFNCRKKCYFSLLLVLFCHYSFITNYLTSSDYSIPRSLLHITKPDDFLEQKFAHHFFLS